MFCRCIRFNTNQERNQVRDSFKNGAKNLSVLVFGTPDSVRCTRAVQTWTSHSREIGGTLRYNSPNQPLFGPIAYISIGRSKYCLVIVDDYSRFTWVFFLQKKSQTQETLKGFLRRAQNEFGLRIKRIRSDNGTEFRNSQVEGFLEDEGIKHEFSSPYTL